MAGYLPFELITEILTKLPVKSLNRFKCVSKTWNSLITSSNFIKHHLHQTLLSNINTNIIISTNSIISSTISAVELHFDIVNRPLNIPVNISGSVHGVLLLVDTPKQSLCLFNPSNKTQRLVPPAPSHKPAFVFKLVVAFGFGYDSVTDDYKVVRLAECQWEVFGFFDRETCVYSMRNDSWEFVNDETVPHTLYESNDIAVDGILCFSMVSRDSKPVLKCFDLRTSTFSLVDFPDRLLDNGSDTMTMSLTSLRGCLCLLVSYRKNICELLYADVWEMKEHKWVKLFRIRKNEIGNHCKFLRVVTYSKDEKSVLIEVDGIWFGLYDLVTKTIERVPVQGLGGVDWPYVAYPNVESLVSVVNNKEGTSRPKKTIKK